MFSPAIPNLQLIWDATSLAALQFCPRYYQLSTIQGWRSLGNEHLDFGQMFQAAVEVFQKERLAGRSVPEARRAALRRALQESGWYVEDAAFTYTFHPWGGDHVARWRCTGTEPFIVDGKRSKRKCPYSHAGKWAEGNADRCPSCDSPTEATTHYLPYHPSKNRLSLLRAVALFCDSQHETDGLQPYAFPDGTPAIELQTVVPLGRRAPCGGDYLMVINLDEINTWRGRHYITDNKTTSRKLTDSYFAQYEPNVQFDTYDLISSIAFGDLDIAGLAVRGIQVTGGGVDSKTRLITKTVGQRDEMFDDLHWWLDLAERMAADGYYPMNRTACSDCRFNRICALDPGFRQAQLAADFEVRRWHPIHRERQPMEDE